MPDLQHPLSLKRHYPTVVEYSATEDAVPQPTNIVASFSVSLGHNNTNPLDWRAALTLVFSLKSEGKEIAKGKVVFVGYFDVSDQVPEAERTNFVARNGGSVLYSATRELVASMTCRSLNRHIILPITSFQDVQIDPNAPKEEVQAQAIKLEP